MGDRLIDKVVVVTGGASGIGQGAVFRFLEEGARVAIGDLNEANGERLVEVAEKKGMRGRVCFLRTDVAEEREVQALVARAVSAFGRFDVMFNNAGIGGAFGPITDVSVDDWDYTFAVLTRGVFLGTKHAARILIDQGEGGSIINTASVAAFGGGLGPQAYSAAKAAVVSLTLTSAVELGSHRIRVNAICPGGILTPLMHAGRPEEASRLFSELQPLSRVGQVEDIADAAIFLASDESSFVTGEALKVDGGLLAVGARTWGRIAGSERVQEIVGVNRGTTGAKSEFRRLTEEG